VAEGAPLLREYRVKTSIEGSNPSLIAKVVTEAHRLDRFASVAQLDRVPGYEPGGQRFESSRMHHIQVGTLLGTDCYVTIVRGRGYACCELSIIAMALLF
jgi:hypothetical protein